MKHAVIFAHPSAHSFTGSVANAYAEAVAAQGHQVITRDLYRMNFDPRLSEEELPYRGNDRLRPDIAAERRLLSDVNIFVLVYPLWLNAPPAMLKGYLDRVFGYGFAYGRRGRSEPLLQGRSLITFSSSGAPLHWLRETGAFDAISKLFDSYFAELCGLSFLEHTHFGAIVPNIREDAVATKLESVKETVKKHFGRPQ